MNLNERMVTHGESMFRWRSYLPLFFVAIAAVGIVKFKYPFNSHAADEVWDALCLALGLCGLAVRVMTVAYVPRGTSGRNTRRLKAPVLNTTGMYSVIRHPLYVGNFLIFMSFVLFIHDPLLTLIAVLCYWMYYERIMLAEEAFLRAQFGESFDMWASRTSALGPRLSSWTPPAMPFCWRSAIRREYSTLFLVVSILFGLEIAGHAVVERRVVIELWWAAMFIGSAAIYLCVRIMKHWTNWLQVADR